MKYYLGVLNETYPVVNDKEILDEISKLQVKLFINRENINIQKDITKENNMKINRAWRDLWIDYKNVLIVDDELLNQFINLTGLSGDEIEDLMDWLLVNPHIDYNSFENVYNKYKESL